MQEYLAVMQTSSKIRTWANDDNMVKPTEELAPAINEATQENNATEELPSQSKKARTQEPVVTHNDEPQPMAVDELDDENKDQTEENAEESGAEAEAAPVSDMDWLRSKTSRLLGLLGDDEQADIDQQKTVERPAKSRSPTPEESRNTAIENIPSQPQTNDEEDITAEPAPVQDGNVDLIRASARLFLRNLAYDLTEADLQPLFAPFGKLEEVSFDSSHPLPTLPTPSRCQQVLGAHRQRARMMILLIGTSDAMHMM